MTRRDLGRLLPALAAAAAQDANAQATKKLLPSKAWRFEDLPVRTNGQNSSRNVFDGLTHSGFHVDLHLTELAPGLAPHPPHKHVHEEILMLQTGTLEVTIEEATTRVTPGSVVYVHSNEMHGWKNAG